MARRLIGAEPLSEPMLEYCRLDPQEQTSMKFKSKYKIFHSWKCIWNVWEMAAILSEFKHYHWLLQLVILYFI